MIILPCGAIRYAIDALLNALTAFLAGLPAKRIIRVWFIRVNDITMRRDGV
jgi:hypothetical protein